MNFSTSRTAQHKTSTGADAPDLGARPATN